MDEKGKYLRKVVRERLIEEAKKGSKICYGELMHDFHIARGGHPNAKNKLCDVLGDISESEHKKGKPYLSAIAVHETDGYPAPDFLTLEGIPEPNGRTEENAKKPLSAADKNYINEQQQFVWNYWKTHED